MSLYIIKLFTLSCSFAYACAMLSYTGELLGFRLGISRHLSYALYGSASAIYTYVTLFHVPIPLIYLQGFFIILLLFRLILSGSWIQHIFASGNFIFHIISIRGVSLALFALFYHENLYWVIRNERIHTISIGLAFFISLCYLAVFSRKLYPLRDIVAVAQNTDYLRILSACQGTLNSLLILGSSVYYFERIPEWFSLYHLSAYILIFIAFYLLFDFCVKNSILHQYKSAYQLYEKQLQKQVDAYGAQVQYLQQMRQFRHDWIHMRDTMFSIIQSGTTENMRDFLSKIDAAMRDLSGTYTEYSNNPLMQAILLDCHALCQKRQIRFEASAVLPEGLLLNDFDLCRIFTNITNNALDANERLPVAYSRYIRLSTSATECWCTITCQNSFNGVLKIVNGRYCSLKEDEFSHGFGIKNMEAVLESCGGFLKIEPDQENREFQINIHIPIGIVGDPASPPQ